MRFLSCEPLLGPLRGIDLTGIGWVIAGGESGPNYRPMDVSWARAIRDACLTSQVPFFFKQWGGRTPKMLGRELDGRTWDEYPSTADAALGAPLHRRVLQPGLLDPRERKTGLG